MKCSAIRIDLEKVNNYMVPDDLIAQIQINRNLRCSYKVSTQKKTLSLVFFIFAKFFILKVNSQDKLIQAHDSVTEITCLDRCSSLAIFNLKNFNICSVRVFMYVYKAILIPNF